MSARDELIEIVTSDPESSGGDVVWATDLVDRHRAESIGHAVARLRAIPVTCTALTGPVWYGDGWNSAITCLEEIGEYQLPDDEAYPGELQRLRTLALQLRAVVRKGGSAEAQRAEGQRLMDAHVAWEKDTKAGNAAPDFFQPGRAYTHRDGSDFHCVAITAHPQTGQRLAMGWRSENDEWHRPTVCNLGQWLHEYDGVQPPTSTEDGAK
jgi:hypothetical protein